VAAFVRLRISVARLGVRGNVESLTVDGQAEQLGSRRFHMLKKLAMGALTAFVVPMVMRKLRGQPRRSATT
jgi:hypothetical protein